MNADNNFFSLNHDNHFTSGFRYNFNMAGGVVPFNAGRRAVFVSSAFDSAARDTIWHRITADINNDNEAKISLAFYSSNEKTVCLNNGTQCDFDMFLNDTDSDKTAKAGSLINADFWSRHYINAYDVPLHGFKGRYLWLMLIIDGNSFIKINRIRIYYPHESFTSYLPENYRDQPNSFFDRFTSIFQAMYLDLDEKIEDFPSEMNPSAASPESLKRLTDWLGLQLFNTLNDAKLRELIPNAISIYRTMGTKQSLIRTVELVCGVTPVIYEYIDTSPFNFVIVMPDTDGLDMNFIRSIIDAIKPAHTSYVILTEGSFVLGSHTYLGLNTKLHSYPPVRLDNKTRLNKNIIT